MISFREINKSKDSSILFIHGLFSSSGFWLHHLTHFKPFKIITCDIDYPSFFSNPETIFKEIEEYTDHSNITASIAHSFGFSVNSKLKKIKNRVNICPVHYNSRKNTEKFISDLKERTNLDDKIIKKTLKSAENYLLKNKIFLTTAVKDMHNFIPNNDIYFSYKQPSNFEGNHFDIEDAIIQSKNLNEFS